MCQCKPIKSAEKCLASTLKLLNLCRRQTSLGLLLASPPPLASGTAHGHGERTVGRGEGGEEENEMRSPSNWWEGRKMTLNGRGLYSISYLNFARSGLTANDFLLLLAQWPVWNAVDRFSCDVAKSSGSLWVTQFWPLLCRAPLSVAWGTAYFHDILGEEYCFLLHVWFTAERNALPQDHGLSLGCVLLHASHETAFIQVTLTLIFH